MPVRRKVFRIEEMNVLRRSARPRARADEPASGRVSGARTTEVPRWPLASLASAARAHSRDVVSINARGTRALDHEADAIHHAIVRTKQEIAALQVDGSGRMMTARALRELAAMAGDTEAATQRILAAAEEIDEAANNLSALVKQTQPQALAHDIRDQVIRILEACNFQDLAGQRITKVVTALNLVEAHNSRMVEIWGGIETFKDAAPAIAGAQERNDVSTSGPKLEGDAGHASQEEIDAMFGPDVSNQ